jgi:1-deoxy-D-xylulose-5-phosphate synthase
LGLEVLYYNFLLKISTKIKVLGIPDEFIEHGNLERLQLKISLDAKSLANAFKFYS